MGFWGKLGKIGLIAGGGLATALTAGAASPALAAAIGAGTGAASGAAGGGGWKGALMGAGLGAATGGIGGGGGAAAGAAKQGIGGTIKNALTKPGMYSKIAGALGTAGPAAGGVAAGMQKGREAENAAAQEAALFKLKESGQHEGALMERAGLDLKRRQFGLDSESDAFKKAMQSAVAKNIQDVKFSGVPSDVPVIRFSGGNRPSAMGPEGRAAAALMNEKAMARLQSGEKFDDLPMLERIATPAFKKPGAVENILGGVGVAGDAIAGAQAQNQQKSLQERILAAIEGVNARPTIGSTAAKVGGPQLSGVTPFVKPPTARMFDPESGDTSNR